MAAAAEALVEEGPRTPEESESDQEGEAEVAEVGLVAAALGCKL